MSEQAPPPDSARLIPVCWRSSSARTAAASSSLTASELVCQTCGLAYPIRDNIPVLLVDEARKPS